jgi:hypothetical protein
MTLIYRKEQFTVNVTNIDKRGRRGSGFTYPFSDKPTAVRFALEQEHLGNEVSVIRVLHEDITEELDEL